MATKISTKLTSSNTEKLSALLAETPLCLKTLSAPLSTDEIQAPLAPGEWSFTEILAHLLACEELTSRAIYLALLLDAPTVPYVHPTRQWNSLLRYDRLPFSELLSTFALRRRVLLHTLHELTDAQWARPVQHQGKRASSVYGEVRTLALHEQAHCQHLAREIAQPE